MTVKRNELIGRLSLAIRASQNVSEAFDEQVAATLGINRTDLRCLDILDQRGPLTAGQLAKAMHLSTGAVTTLVDRLERAGYARRVRDTEDRRRVLVEVAGDTLQRTGRFYEPLYENFVRLVEGRSDRELARMTEFLEQGTAMVEQELEKLERASPA